MAHIKNQYRYLAQITIEATSPLQIGSGLKGIKSDSLVVRDVNDLPFIPGTTLAGLLRHALDDNKESLMGNQQTGARLIITEAKLLDKQGRPIDGLADLSSLSQDNQEFLGAFHRLPIRQHVRISHRGAAENTGKFDEEVVLKGARFCFEMELIAADEKAVEDFNALISLIQSPAFRIGSGSRSGFGCIKVVKCLTRNLDLDKPEERKLYLQKSSSLSEPWSGWQSADDKLKQQTECEGWTCYRLAGLSPADFVLFGSGFGDPEGSADMTYVKESFIRWTDNQADTVSQEQVVLIPATSVKGALSHRTAYYYNQQTGAVIMADGTLQNGKKPEEVVGNRNEAVKAIFGSEGDRSKETGKLENKRRGRILISDVIQLKTQAAPKVLNHVSIDRFTGGAIDGALFNEQTLYAKGERFDIDILIADEALTDGTVRTAFESALKDVANGQLPLGGGVNRGNGVFKGKVVKLNKENKQWEELA